MLRRRWLPVYNHDCLVYSNFNYWHLATGGSFISISLCLTNVIYGKCFTNMSSHLEQIANSWATSSQWRAMDQYFWMIWRAVIFSFCYFFNWRKALGFKIPNNDNSDSQYYNCKDFPSIASVALSDVDSCFTLIDLFFVLSIRKN